jgi:uncharacterized protein (TIGR03437 family)
MTAALTRYRFLAAILFAVLTMQAPATVKTRPAPASPLSQPAGANLSRDYGKLPLAFEPNVGQTDAQVRFLARGGGMTTFFTDSETVMVLGRRPRQAAPGQVEQAVVRMKLAGAGQPQRAIGIEKLPGISNYFIGNDPTKWRTDVPHYARIQYEGVYPGIDLVWYGNQRRLEYDFVVAPGADPKQIQVAYEGVESLRVDAGGDLVLRTALGEMRQQKPRVYQEVRGKQVEVAARYAIVAGNRLSFELARYDRQRTLRIDPVVLVYSTYLGGNNTDDGYGIAVDSSGSAYVTGYTSSPGFPTTHSAYKSTYQGGTYDAFVTKLTPAGNALVYSTYLGGSGNDLGQRIAVDAAGSAYVTGRTDSADFATQSAYQTKYQGGTYDAFVTKLTPTGNALLYSTYLGGSGDDQGNGIAVDTAGSAYVTGSTNSTDYPTQSAYQAKSGGGYDAFVTKLTPAGTALGYSTYLGGGGAEYGLGIAVDTVGSAYVTGFTQSPNYPTQSAYQATYQGGTYDAFVTKLTPTGIALVYSTYLGGSGSDGGYGIAVDGAGSAYVTGNTSSPNYPTQAAYQAAFGGGQDAFVTKLMPAGNALGYSTYLGGSGIDWAFGIAVDGAGSAYVTGPANSTNYPTQSAYQATNGGGYDAFVTKLAPVGNALVYSTYLGGGDLDYGHGIAVDGAGSAYVTGYTYSPDFPTQSAYQATYQGASDAFVAKLVTPVTPTALTFSSSVGGSSQTQYVSTTSAVSSLVWAPAGTWLLASISGGNQVAVTVSPGSLAAGTYTGTVTVNGEVVSVTLIRSGVPCTLAVSTRSVTVPSAGVAGSTLAVTASASDCVWTASANAPWLSVSGGATVTYTAAANTGTLRTGTLTVAGHAIYINQLGPGDAASSGAAIPNGAVVNAASGSAPIAPGAFVTIYGQNLADSSATWDSAIVNGQLPASLAGVRVSINGKSAFPSMVRPTQINVLAPADTATGPVDVDVFTPHGVATATVNMTPLAPALFTYALGGKVYAAALFASDYSYVAAAGAIPGVTTRAARPGDYVLLFTSVLGPTKPANTVGRVLDPILYPIADLAQIKVTIGGRPAPVSFAGLTFPGLFQVNIQIPASVPAGDQPVVILVGNQSSPAGVALTIGN